MRDLITTLEGPSKRSGAEVVLGGLKRPSLFFLFGSFSFWFFFFLKKIKKSSVEKLTEKFQFQFQFRSFPYVPNPIFTLDEDFLTCIVLSGMTSLRFGIAFPSCHSC